MNIYIRADGAPEIGSGHIMRCITLADAIAEQSEADVSFTLLARNITTGLSSLIKAKGYDLLTLNDNVPKPDPEQGPYGAWLGTTQIADANSVLDVMSEYGAPDILICDHYGLDVAFETVIRNAHPNLGLVVIDDLDRHHDCDLLVDTTYRKSAVNYAGRIPKDTALMTGARFALLRPDFARQRCAALDARDARLSEPPQELLISMGGMDNDNASETMLLSVLDMPIPPKMTHILVGPDAPHIERLKSTAANASSPVKIHAGIDDVASLLSRVDICIGAAGSSTWERCCLGLPTLNIAIADNQIEIAKRLSSIGAVIDGGTLSSIRSQNLTQNLANLVANPAHLKEISLAAREVCDGGGAARVAMAVLDGSTYSLREAGDKDIRTVFVWQQHPDTRRFAVNPEPPTWEGHQAWMKKRLRRGKFYILDIDGKPKGLVRLDSYRDGPLLPDGIMRDAAEEVSILVAPDSHGRGLGTRMLDLLRLSHPEALIIAHVFDTNQASRKLFLRCGYEPFAPEYLIQLPS